MQLACGSVMGAYTVGIANRWEGQSLKRSRLTSWGLGVSFLRNCVCLTNVPCSQYSSGQENICNCRVLPSEASKPIPEHWELVRSEQKDGKTSCCYICQATGQHFYSYEGLARYVKYAKAAEVSIYAQDFNADDFKRKSGRFKGQLPLVGEHSSTVCQEPAAVEKSPEEEMTILLGVTDSAEGCSAGEVSASVGEPARNGLEKKPAANLEGTSKGKVILRYFRRRFKGKEKLEKMQVQTTN